MPSTLSLVKQLRNEYPQLTFVKGDDFHWSPSTRTIFFKVPGETSLLLHELGHALLMHRQYARDIELLEMEQAAWTYAVSHLSNHHAAPIAIDTIEAHIDSYRDWLHARSTCPSCASTGVQVAKKEYKCLACGTRWHVNEARTCALRRYVHD